MKDLKNLNGAKTISKNDQRAIKGGRHIFPTLCRTDADCADGEICFHDEGNISVCIAGEDPVQP